MSHVPAWTSHSNQLSLEGRISWLNLFRERRLGSPLPLSINTNGFVFNLDLAKVYVCTY